MMRQKYKDAVYYFREHPEEIVDAWKRPQQHPYGYLFHFCSPDGRLHYVRGCSIGCPLMIAKAPKDYRAWTPDLTERCKQEFSHYIEDITDKELQALGHLQSDMDQTIRNPEWLKDHRYQCYPGCFDELVLVGLRLHIQQDIEEPQPNEED